MKAQENKVENPNRFTYSDDDGLVVISKGSDKKKTAPKETDKPTGDSKTKSK